MTRIRALMFFVLLTVLSALSVTTAGAHAVDPCSCAELLFYNADGGAIATGTVDTGGTFTGHKVGSLSVGWTAIVPGAKSNAG